LKRYVLESIYGIEDMGYGFEISLTRYAQSENVRVKVVLLKELTHVMKEEKLGIVRGLGERAKMYWQIALQMDLSRIKPSGIRKRLKMRQGLKKD